MQTSGAPVIVSMCLVVVLTAAVLLLRRALASLRRSEVALRTVFEAASDAIAVTSAELKILEINTKGCELLGYSREKAVGSSLLSFLAPGEVIPASLAVEVVHRDRVTVHRERQFVRGDGTLFTAELSVRALRDGRLVVVARDITERREAEDALRDREATARSVIYTAVDGIITADQHGTIQSFNPAAERLFGWPAEGVIGHNLSMLMPSPDRERHDDYIRTYLETGKAKIIGTGREVVAMRRDGSTFPIELAVSEMLLPGRRLFTGIVRDITERKRTEQALRETNTRLEALIRTSPLAVVTLDLKGRVQTWNPAAEQMFGWTAEEVLNRPYPVIPDAERDAFLASLAEAGSVAFGFGAERRRVRRDGTVIDTIIWTAALRDPEGRVTGGLGIMADMTGRRALEEQLRQSQKMDAVGRLAGGIAHDFNNVLTVITGYGQMLLEHAGSAAQVQSDVEAILMAAEHAAELTSRLLVFSRHHVRNPQPVDINALVANVQQLLRRIIGEDIELTTVLPGGVGPLLADPSQIEQSILNLIVNAREAMPDGGRIVIETANVQLGASYASGHVDVAEGEYVMLAVSDTGKGISPEVRQRIFEPFFTTKERGKGAGLGLSTVYGVVKQSGGHIWVYSEPGKGTSFKLYFPRTADAAAPAQPKAELPVAVRGAETILLAEDEVAVRVLVRDILRQQGYAVLEADDPEDALRLCREHDGDIHLLVTDLVMPVMSGKELAERATQFRPGMRVLYMSGYTDNIVLHHGIESSSTQFLQKPFTPLGLARKVREILEQ